MQIRHLFLFLLGSLMLISCNSSAETPSSSSTEDDTIPKAAPPAPSYTSSPIALPEKLETLEIGDLNLPSGEIIAADPFFTSHSKPFRRSVEPGTYPVVLGLAQQELSYFRLAFSKLVFSEHPVVRWEMAIEQDFTESEIISLTPEDFVGFGVEAGLACFLDATTNIAYLQKQDQFYADNPSGNYYDDVLAAEFALQSGSHEKSSSDGDWCNHVIQSGEPGNVIIFSSGWGDGYYPSYWGLDAEGQPVELIIDFLLSDAAP